MHLSSLCNELEASKYASIVHCSATSSFVLPFCICSDVLTNDKISLLLHLFESLKDSAYRLVHNNCVELLFLSTAEIVTTINRTIIHSTTVIFYIQAQWAESKRNIRGWVSSQGNSQYFSSCFSASFSLYSPCDDFL